MKEEVPQEQLRSQLLSIKNQVHPLLTRFVNSISETYFHQPFQHQATFNTRLRTTGGRYHLASHNLDFNPKVLEKYELDDLVAVIKHELCHYHLHLAGKGYRHQDSDFKQLLKATGGTRYVKPLIEPSEQKMFQYQCQKCGQTIVRKRRLNLKKYRCRCHGELVFVAEK